MKLICLQLDLARQKESVSFIKSYVDYAVENGYNTLVLYLENAVRTNSVPFFNTEESYSPEEMQDIIAYAENKGLDVIPAFENLGHLERFFVYPQIEKLSECEDEQKEGRGFDRYKRGSCGCVANPDLYKFMDNYIREVGALFHSPYVHMGLDEPFDFAVCDRCKEKMARNGWTKADLFYEHVMHSYNLVKSMGKRMMMWDDFFQYADIAERLPRDIIFCNWNYYFIGNEPSGHWTNRIKRDWFTYYDKLGFEYLFCVYGHRASSTYNLDSFTQYAEKHRPLGGLVTQWCRSDSFYLGSYPFIAYAGRKWNGQVCDESEKLAIYANILGGKEQAELVLSLEIPTFYWGYNNVTQMCEDEYLIRTLYRKQLEYAVQRLRVFCESAQGRAKDILTDIYDYVWDILLSLQLQNLGAEIFDNYETRKRGVAYFQGKLDEFSEGYREIQNNATALWAKYKAGIKSFGNALENKYVNAIERNEKLKAEIAAQEEVGVLYIDLMLYDGFSTVRAEIRVKYKGDKQETTLYRGNIKPSVTGFEVGGCYSVRFAIKPKKVDYIVFGVFGEGALYPLHFRYTLNGEKYVAARVEKLCGQVENEANILYNDTRFAKMGYDDGTAHFNDLALSKQMHEIKVTFRNLGEQNEKV